MVLSHQVFPGISKLYFLSSKKEQETKMKYFCKSFIQLLFVVIVVFRLLLSALQIRNSLMGTYLI